MYKKQMIFQKYACMAALIAAALVFVSSLGLSTDLYDALSRTILYPDYDLEATSVPGSRVYYDMFGFNSAFTKAGIVLIVINLLLFITNTHTRRKYYIGNYVAICLNAVANIGVALWAHGQIAAFKAQYLSTVDFAQLERRLSRAGTYTDSTFWFDVHTAIFAFALLVVFLLVVSTAWKVSLMRNEKKLIEAGKAVSA
jgi:hypothetical protein